MNDKLWAILQPNGWAKDKDGRSCLYHSGERAASSGYVGKVFEVAIVPIQETKSATLREVGEALDRQSYGGEPHRRVFVKEVEIAALLSGKMPEGWEKKGR